VKARRVEKLEDMLAQCDVITVNCPLHEGTKGLINKETLKHVKKGAWIVNTARGAICDRAAIKEALESGHINGKLLVIPYVLNVVSTPTN
jgi:formate dehydrogenase